MRDRDGKQGGYPWRRDEPDPRADLEEQIRDPGGAPAGASSARWRQFRLVISSGLVLVAATLVVLLAVEGAARLYAALRGNVLAARHGFATTKAWPDPGVSTPEFHTLVADRYADFGDYYAYAGFPDPAQIPWTDEPVRINRFGLRGPDFELAPRPGVFRLVAMGESSTFGFMVDDAQAYPVRLQEILVQRLGPDAVEVINAGLPYYTTEDMSILLQQLVRKMEPDLVTFYIGYNDATLLTRLLLERRMRADAGALPAAAIDVRTFLLERSLVLNRLARRLEARLRGFAVTEGRFPPLSTDEAEEVLDGVEREFAHRVQALHRQACALGIDHAFVSQLHAPLNMWDGTMEAGDDPFDFLVPEARGGTYYTYAAALRDQLAREGLDQPVEVFWYAHHRVNDWLLGQPGLRTLDFVRSIDGDWSRLATLVHLNAAGNEALARFLADAVRDAAASHDATLVAARCR
jgi:lysophospholipase L1-like esterase